MRTFNGCNVFRLMVSCLEGGIISVGCRNMFCSNCGTEIDDKAVVCVKCGVPTANFKSQSSSGIFESADPSQGYDWLTTLLLCFFVGAFGVHSFYTKKTGIGIAQLITLGGCGIWALIDFVMIIVGSYRDGEGRLLVRK